MFLLSPSKARNINFTPTILVFNGRMSLSSTRLGLLLVGLGILLLGLYLNRKHYDGFQAGSGAPKMEPLITRDADIRNKFMLIDGIKEKSDATLKKLLTTSEMIALDILYSEVSSYVKGFTGDIKEIFAKAADITPREAAAAEVGDLVKLAQVIYTVNDQVDMLHKIYYTIPSTIISSKAVVNPDTAPSNTVSSDAVLTEAIPEITIILSNIPDPKTKLNAYMTQIKNKITTIQKDQSDAQLTDLLRLLQHLILMVNAVLSNLSFAVSSIRSNYTPLIGKDPTALDKINSVMNEKIDFQKMVLSSCDSFSDLLKTVQNPVPLVSQILTNLDSQTALMRSGIESDTTSLNMIVTNANNNMPVPPVAPPPPGSTSAPPPSPPGVALPTAASTAASTAALSAATAATAAAAATTSPAATPRAPPTAPAAPMSTGMTEGFASYMNPYNQPSPSISQAYEFRLGKNSYLDEIFKSIQPW